MEKEIIERCRKFGVVGIRHPTCNESYEIGSICRNSYERNYEKDDSTFYDEEPIELD